MGHLHAFCAQTLLLVALIAGTSLAGLFRPEFEENRSSRSKLRHQKSNKAADYSYGPVSPPPCTPGSPQIPNYIQPMKIDPARMMGKWYPYMEWYDGIPDRARTTVNFVTTLTNLIGGSLTLYPGSNTPAIAIEQLYGTANASNNNQCHTAPVGYSYLDYLTVDGQQRGIGFLTGPGADIDTTLVLATDYETYALFYDCNTYDIKSGICAQPLPYVFTRERPDKVSATTANTVVSAINTALGSYCFTAGMMKTFPWLNDLPDCPLVTPTDSCYTSVRNAYLYLGDPNFTG